jgi:hypothetical protein
VILQPDRVPGARLRRGNEMKTVGQGGGVMAKKRKSQFVLPEKQCWHLYSLQNLNPEKFIKVVGKILKKDYLLIK